MWRSNIRCAKASKKKWLRYRISNDGGESKQALFTLTHMPTMQSVVTGQAPITLERKITSGGKQIKTEDNTHNNWKNRIPQRKIKMWDQRTYVSRYIDIIYFEVYHMLNEPQQKPKPKRQHSTQTKKTGWNEWCPNRNRKVEKREGTEARKIIVGTEAHARPRNFPG